MRGCRPSWPLKADLPRLVRAWIAASAEIAIWLGAAAHKCRDVQLMATHRRR